MINLKNKVALITGASRGIGKACALYFAKAGANVIINYHQTKNIDKLVEECQKFKIKALPFKADIASESDCRKIVKFAIKSLGRVDILVNNAGVWTYAPIDKMSDKILNETLDVNLRGVFYLTRAVVPFMKKQKAGNIINISSTAGQRGETEHSHYAASKGAIISLTKSLATELAPWNIRVNCVAPGWVYTDMSKAALKSKESKKILSTIPLKRVGTPEEIAGAVLFLASDLSSFITGEILNVNGGAVLCG
ncbi:MAG: short-chain alcohol dehydrogenase [candidate division Zixibacteria bacterium RBG-1]|nr:MAG: short-chain alcohol dehydrogenase [candidate division Zixibacteria bacterium RBG-1]OGC86612.1 MAG: hypothetical protein A2V73_07245 [candidate division Zixibacteria bacterium RBG_19FT_COMBO_42_43]